MSAQRPKLLFVGGLHRSGTTPFVRMLGSAPNVSIFRNTGAIEDEGQFLQTVFPPDGAFGGPGRFAFDPAAHLLEAANANDLRDRLYWEWARFWNLRADLVVEKTPAHIIQARFLHSLFPDAFFVFLVRHPIPVSLATARWCGAYLPDLFKHWLHAHDLLLADLPLVRNATVIYYEDLVAHPEVVVRRLSEKLGIALGCNTQLIQHGRSNRYFISFLSGGYHLKGRPLLIKTVKRLVQIASVPLWLVTFDRKFRRFGYSLMSYRPLSCSKFSPWLHQ